MILFRYSHFGNQLITLFLSKESEV